jgi:hypothetical protein
MEVPLGAGQWPGEITLKRLARYALSNYFILDLGPGRKGRTEKQVSLSRRKMTFCYLRLLNKESGQE